MFGSLQSKPTIQSWSPWRKGWPRLLWSTCITLYLLGLTCACIALVLVSPLTYAVSGSNTYTISGPLYQGNVFSGVTRGDNIKTIQLYPDRDRAVQHKAWTCTKACLQTTGCQTFVIRGSECYLSSFSACQNAGKRFLLEWNGATTYELRASNEDDLHQTCLAQCLEERGCGGCGRPLCNGTLCENCPSTCWGISPPTSGSVAVYPNLSTVRKVTCNGHWQLWWRSGNVSLYYTMLLEPLQLRAVIRYANGLLLQSDFEKFEYKNGSITVGKFLHGAAGNGWNAPFEMRAASTPPESNCLRFFYSEEPCEANGIAPYKEQRAVNGTNIHRGYFWHTMNNEINKYIIKSIELWVKPMELRTNSHYF